MTRFKVSKFLFLRGFIEVCPGGALDKEGIMAMYLMPRDKAKVFIDEMFRMFDADGNGTVSFKVSCWYVLAQKLETFKTCKLFSLIVLKNAQCIVGYNNCGS